MISRIPQFSRRSLVLAIGGGADRYLNGYNTVAEYKGGAHQPLRIEEIMPESHRIGPEDVRNKMQAGEATLLVCAYDNEIGFKKNQIDGAIPLEELNTRLPSLAMDHEIVFY